MTFCAHVNRTSNSVFSASFLPKDFIEGPPLNEEIPQKEPKYVHEMVGRKRKNRIVYGSGMCSTGALAIEKLLTFPSLTQCLWQPMRIVRMNAKNIKFIAAGCGFSFSQRFYHTGDNKPAGLFHKLKFLFKRYWLITLTTHSCLSIFGLDIVIVLEFLWLPESWVQKVRELPKSASTIAAALILYKIFTPVRYFTTIFLTYKILKLRRH
ncbi:Fe2OG dioxygenase domain-containing protein [Meloidogyne graminicola]|uniref:Fe2OG dioxygenase domain-containing protein n=1 Tax=Meloidogyne graminicola TaxID=189291 RepID=A0A8S9ZQR3_9BILA|nr:Fe2OG dioxygenase domain-containing protein [Meloidogyne graminicola]